MATKPLGATGAANMLRQKLNNRVRERAEQLSSIAVDLHQNAPRGGPNTNKYGQQRSAPGEAPAVEDGTLLSELQTPPVPVNTGAGESAAGAYSVMVNWVELEFGTRNARIAPRPLGRQSVARLRQEVE